MKLPMAKCWSRGRYGPQKAEQRAILQSRRPEFDKVLTRVRQHVYSHRKHSLDPPGLAIPCNSLGRATCRADVLHTRHRNLLAGIFWQLTRLRIARSFRSSYDCREGIERSVCHSSGTCVGGGKNDISRFAQGKSEVRHVTGLKRDR